MNKEEQVETSFRDLLNKKYLLEKFKMEESLKGYTNSEVHCITYLGRNADSNVTKLAESLFMTRGAVSKITKKLLQKGLIEGYQKPENKKEVYFRLTDQGNEVYKIHEGLHREFQERDKAVFEQIPEKEFDIILSFVEQYNRHLDTEIKKQGVDITNRNDIEG